MENRKKRFFTNHAKSSAMVVSLAVHAVLLVVALSFVAVTVIKKDDQKFESRQVSRPKMELKKLRVPVKIKKKRPKPRLRKQITVKARANHMPEIKMPEIVGIKGGWDRLVPMASAVRAGWASLCRRSSCLASRARERKFS